MSKAYPFPPIFIISLKDSSRRSIIAQRLQALGLNFAFFDAVDGRKLSEQDLAQVDYAYYPKRFGQKPLTLGEVGCALSHIKLYEYLRERDIPEAIILEDDAFPTLYFPEILKEALKKLPKKAEMLFLDHGKAKICPFTRSLPERYRLARYLTPSRNSKRVIIRATGYYLTKIGIKKLLDKAYPIRLPADYLTGNLQLTGIHAYGIEPSCVSYFNGESEIYSVERRYED